MGPVEMDDRKDLAGTIKLESIVNAVGERRGIAAFSEETDFGRGIGECRVNNEPVETSWELDLG